MNDGHTLTASVPFKRLRASASACCIFAVTALASFAALPALAQAGLPNTVVTKVALEPADKTVIADFVTPLKPLLIDEAKLKSGREQLLAPLNVAGVTPSFRLELWKQVSATVPVMIKSPNDTLVVNGLRIAGEIATDTSVALVTDSLKSPKSSIRFAASFAIRRAFEAVQGPTKLAAMDLGTVKQLIRALTVAMKTETDPKCFDAMARAIAAAADIQVIAGAQAEGLKSLAGVTGELFHSTGVKAIDDETLEAFVRAGTTIRDSLTNQQSPPAWLDAGMTFSEEALSYVYRQLHKPNSELATIKAGDDQATIDAKVAARKVVTQLVAISESGYTLANQLRQTPIQAPGVSMSDLIRRADTTADATVSTYIEELLKDKRVR